MSNPLARQAGGQRPAVGRVAHYVSHGTPPREDGTQAYPSVCRAATITEVDPQDLSRVGLAVIHPKGFGFHPLADGGLRYDAGKGHPADDSPTCLARHEPGSWHWPARV